MAVAGKFVGWAAGTVMLLFEVYWFWQWWELVGLLVALFIPPLAVAFPFIYLFKEGFSPLYFGFWGVSLLGFAVAAVSEATESAY